MTSRALHSCFLCRRNKRRCDKNLPSCQLCVRKGWKCSYPQRRGQRSASPPPSLESVEAVNDSNSVIANPPLAHSGILARNQTASSPPSSFAVNVAISFLAPDLFREGALEIPRLNLDIPEDVTLHLGDRRKLRETARQFFQITWMPIIGRKRYLNTVLNPLSPLRRPTILLALCMKLCCLEVLDDGGKERGSLYQSAKTFYSEVESTEGLCLQVLQAGILIAIFEIGDAIYPAAYLTVGACARYGVAMGLDKINQERMGGDHNHAASWMEIEERRRAWWGVLILDRSVASVATPIISYFDTRNAVILYEIFGINVLLIADS
jgi:Fungal Zn(2)-Cys(6) binuclear cluster domain/Fungal specific transcription factor domain